MPTVQEFLRVATAELGTVESPAGSNRTKYGAWYGMNGVPWCAIWVDWCYVRCGGEDLRSLISRDWAYTPAGVNGFKRKGWWYPPSEARPGDIVFFDFRPGGDSIEHVGIVESVNVAARSMVTLEGNTSGTDWANGGQVLRRTRGFSLIPGVGRLPLTVGWGPTPPPSSEKGDKDMVLIRGKGRNEVWLTDFMTRTWIPSPQHLQAIQFILAAGGKDSSVKDVEGWLVDGIPRNMPDNDWLRFADALSQSTVDKLVKAGVGTGTDVSPEVLAGTVADELSRRLMG
jgi:hypothetical protein